MSIDLTILVPTKNEEKNIEFCLLPLVGWAKEVIIIDSNSTDKTPEIALEMGTQVINFDYQGGWPKKRQHVLNTYNFKTKWVLLLDADEILDDVSKNEIEKAISNDNYDGYYLWFYMEFLGKMLTRSSPGLRKLSLFKVNKGAFENRFNDQDNSMGDMEVHEHIIVEGNVGIIKSPILHRNFNNLSRYIIKHDEYSNYECRVHTSGQKSQLSERLFGKKEERRRYVKKKLIRNPIAPIGYFFYLYIIKGGFLDGKAGFYYILYQCMYLYFVSSKIYELERLK